MTKHEPINSQKYCWKAVECQCEELSGGTSQCFFPWHCTAAAARCKAVWCPVSCLMDLKLRAFKHPTTESYISPVSDINLKFSKFSTTSDLASHFFLLRHFHLKKRLAMSCPSWALLRCCVLNHWPGKWRSCWARPGGHPKSCNISSRQYPFLSGLNASFKCNNKPEMTVKDWSQWPLVKLNEMGLKTRNLHSVYIYIPCILICLLADR